MIIRTSIEYLSSKTIRVTTPFRQRTFTLPKSNTDYYIDFSNLALSPSEEGDERVLVYWDEDYKTLEVDDLNATKVSMPTEASSIILKVEI